MGTPEDYVRGGTARGYLREHFKTLSSEQLRQQLIEVCASIADNDGRLSADSSADLDYAMDKFDVILGIQADHARLAPVSQATPDLPVLFAVHNGMVNLTDETAQFVERSYLIPSELLPRLYGLLEPFEVGSAPNFLDIPMGGRPDGV